MSLNKGGGVGGGSGVNASTHYVVVYVFGRGDGEHLAQVAVHFPPRGLFMKAPARGYSLSGPAPRAEPWPSPGTP